MQRTHFGQHGADCFGCKLQTLQFTPSSMPSRRDGAHCASANRRDKVLSKDLAAFKRLRQEGYNPKAIDGLAQLEQRVETGFELERGMSAAEMARTTPSARRDDASTRRDIAKGAPEFRRRALDLHEHLSKQDPTKPREIDLS